MIITILKSVIIKVTDAYSLWRKLLCSKILWESGVIFLYLRSVYNFYLPAKLENCRMNSVCLTVWTSGFAITLADILWLIYIHYMLSRFTIEWSVFKIKYVEFIIQLQELNNSFTLWFMWKIRFLCVFSILRYFKHDAI